jgi:hypothetical protein
MPQNSDYTKERIKLYTEWFKLVSTIFVLDTGSIGIILSRKSILEDTFEQFTGLGAIVVWIVLLWVLLYLNKKIAKFVELLKEN